MQSAGKRATIGIGSHVALDMLDICAIHEVLGKANPPRHTKRLVLLTLPSIQTDHNKD